MKKCDVLVIISPPRPRSHGFPWEKIQASTPKLIVASQGFRSRAPYETCKSTRMFRRNALAARHRHRFSHGLPLVTARSSAMRHRLHLAPAFVAALYQRTHGHGPECHRRHADGCSLARQAADHSARPWPRSGYNIQYGRKSSRSATPVPLAATFPEAAAARRASLKCKVWETRFRTPTSIYTRRRSGEKICDVMGRSPSGRPHPP